MSGSEAFRAEDLEEALYFASRQQDEEYEEMRGLLIELHEELHRAQGHQGPARSCYATLLCERAAEARRR